MKSRQEQSDHDDFNDTAQKFRRWRAKRPRGARIPASLWRSAAALASVYGVSRTSTVLGLDYYSLKKRLGACSTDSGASRDASTRDATAHFVEMSLGGTHATFRCAIEVEKRAGGAEHCKLRLELESIALTDLDVLLHQVWGPSA